MVEITIHSESWEKILEEGAAIKEMGFTAYTQKPVKIESKDKEWLWHFTK
jgi:hypothetical protein